MRRTTLSWFAAAIVSTTAVAVPAANAQTNAAAAAIFQSQSAQLRRALSELAAGPPQKQLFNLWFADLLLSGNQGPLGPAGLEEAIADGALDRLQELERSGNVELRDLAMLLRARLVAQLDVENANAGNRVAENLAASRRITLKQGEYDRWLTIAMRAGMEYQLEARGCPVLKAIAVAEDRRRPIAGGTVFGSTLSFVGTADEPAFLRIRTPLCGSDGTVSVSVGPPVLPLTLAPTKDRAQPVMTGSVYRGSLSKSEEQWIRLDVRAGQRYEVSTEPENSELDTIVDVYGADGSEIASDDDGGIELGSKVEVVPNITETLRIKVRSIDGAGAYKLAIVSKQDPSASAGIVNAGSTTNGAILSAGSEEWWRLETQPGARYVFEAIPSSDLDTVITVFDSRAEKRLGSDDDGGSGLGSRLQYANREEKSLLIKIHGARNTMGTYRLSVSGASMLARLNDAPTSADPQPVNGGPQNAPNLYRGSLRDHAQQWVRLLPRASRIYVFETTPDTDLDTVITAYEKDGTTEIDSDDDGGSGLGSRLELAASPDRPVLVKISRIGSKRGDYELSVADKPSPLESAKAATVGTANEGTLSSNTEEWWTIPVQAGTYIFEATPIDRIDTVLTLYDPEGITELKSDDDGGVGSGSRLEFANTTPRTLVVKVSRLGSVGRYRLDVSPRRPPAEIAKPVVAGMKYQATLDQPAEHWWSLRAEAGRTYVFETTVQRLLDTAITLYDEDGTKELGSDDDGGTGLGSKLEFKNFTQRTLLIKVHRLDSDTGGYTLDVRETR